LKIIASNVQTGLSLLLKSITSVVKVRILAGAQKWQKCQAFFHAAPFLLTRPSSLWLHCNRR